MVVMEEFPFPKIECAVVIHYKDFLQKVNILGEKGEREITSSAVLIFPGIFHII